MLNFSHVNSFLFISLNSFPEFIEKTFRHIYTHDSTHHIVYNDYIVALRNFVEETYKSITDLTEKKALLLELIIIRKVVAKREKQLVNIGGPFEEMFISFLGARINYTSSDLAESRLTFCREIISYKLFNLYNDLSEICHATNGKNHTGRLCLERIHPPWGAYNCYDCYICRWLSTLENTSGLCFLENLIFSFMSSNWHWSFEAMDWLEASHFYLIFTLENTSLISLAKQYLPKVPKTTISEKLAALEPDRHFIRDFYKQRDNTVIDKELSDFLYDFRTCFPHLYISLSELEKTPFQIAIWQIFGFNWNFMKLEAEFTVTEFI